MEISELANVVAMTKSYKIAALVYRLILGLLTVGYLINAANADVDHDRGYYEPWFFPIYSVSILVLLTVFLRMRRDHPMRVFLQIVLCLLVASGLAGLIFFILSVLRNEDGNLLVSGVLFISVLTNIALLFHLVRDKKYRPT